MLAEDKTPREQIEEILKNFWLKKGNPSVIAAKHTEFVVEPLIYIGDQLNPEILKLLVINYLMQSSRMDSGVGDIDVTPDKLIIKNRKGKPLIVVNDRSIIQQYLAAKQYSL